MSAGSVESSGELSAAGNPKISDRAQASAGKAIDGVVEYLKQAGRTDRVMMWNSRRDQPITIADIQTLLDDFDLLLEHNEFRAAERLSPELQIVADEMKNESLPVFVIIQLRLNGLDDNVERYDSALKRLDAVSEALNEHDVFPLEGRIALIAGQANALRKLGKYAEAEKMYLRYFKESEEHRDCASKDCVLSAKFQLAAMYFDMGAFQKCKQWMPKEERVYQDENGTPNSERIALMLSTNVKYYLSGDKRIWMLLRTCVNGLSNKCSTTKVSQVHHTLPRLS